MRSRRLTETLRVYLPFDPANSHFSDFEPFQTRGQLLAKFLRVRSDWQLIGYLLTVRHAVLFPLPRCQYAVQNAIAVKCRVVSRTRSIFVLTCACDRGKFFFLPSTIPLHIVEMKRNVNNALKLKSIRCASIPITSNPHGPQRTLVR